MAQLNCLRANESGLATVPRGSISAGSPRDLPSIARSMSCGTLGCHPDAGGDLAVFGPKGLMVDIRDPGHPSRALCRIELRDAAIASSGPQFNPLRSLDVIDPASGTPVYAVIGATVRASSCQFADALTKVVTVGGPSAASLLRQFDAGALFVAADGEVYITPEWRDAAVLAA